MASVIYYILMVVCFLVIGIYGILKVAKPEKFDETSKWLLIFACVSLLLCAYFAVTENIKEREKKEHVSAADIEKYEQKDSVSVEVTDSCCIDM